MNEYKSKIAYLEQQLAAEKAEHTETAQHLYAQLAALQRENETLKTREAALFDFIHETENANSGYGLVMAKEKLKQRLGI